MSINKTIKVKNDHQKLDDVRQEPDDVRQQPEDVRERPHDVHKKPDDVNELPAIDQTQDSVKDAEEEKLEPGSYEGRKYQSEIDGPQQDSQETDDVYDDEREKDSGLPPAGKNVGELNAFDLGRHDKD